MSDLAELVVQHQAGACRVSIQTGLFERTGQLLRSPELMGSAQRCAIVTDSNVGSLYGRPLQENLERAGFQSAYIEVPAGENSKSLAMVGSVADRLASAKLDRHGFIIGLGGGVIGDLTGFAAAVYYRGVPHVQIPTTVIAQSDSAIGGKTGVNIAGGKNLLGAFHPPRAVIVDPGLLDSLPEREFNEGFAEVIKHGIIADPQLFDACLFFHRVDTARMLRRSLEIKAAVVNTDEFETKDIRAKLNFGHTIGHGIEQAAGYGRLLHGEAISLGIKAASYLSVRHAGLPEEAAASIEQCLEMFKLPTRLPADIDTAAVVESLLLDKKFRQGQIRFVLTPRLGEAFLSPPGMLTVNDLRQAVVALHS